MLTTLFTAIQTAIGSFTRGFLIVTLLPTVLFVMVNVAVLRGVSPAWRDRLAVTKVSTDFLTGVVWFMLIVTTAIVLGALQPWLFQLTEGEHMPEPLCRWQHALQKRHLDALQRCAETAFRTDEQLNSKIDVWRTLLELPSTGKGGAHPAQATLAGIARLEALRQQGRNIDAADLNALVRALNADLRVISPEDLPVPLRDARRRLLRLLNYARDRSKYDYVQAQNRLQAVFPGDVFDPEPLSDNILAPTTFGNIGRTMRSYGLRRYRLDLDIFWNRLQKVMADSTTSKTFDSLQVQKSQLDFLVNLFWLTILTGLVWFPWLAAERLHPTLFCAIGIGVPWLAYVLYRTACRSYVVFADQVRTAVDYFRFDVLSGLRISMPAGTLEEEQLWERLGNRVGYARKDAIFTYVRKP